MNNLITICFVLIISNLAYSQQSENLKFLMDSIPAKDPILLNLPVDKGFMAVERISISNNGKNLYYGTRNGYDSTSTAEIKKIKFSRNNWSKPEVVFKDSCGAPALNYNDKTMFFQYDHPKSPKGIYSIMTKKGWTKPKSFIDSLQKSHYLQSPKKNVFYYSSKLSARNDKQDIFKVTVSKNDTIIKKIGFNLKGDFADFFVSNDESYIIIGIAEKKNSKEFTFFGKLDLFISFKKEEDNWTKPLNLGKKINGLSDWSWGPYVTNDNKYLIFSSWSEPVGTYIIKFNQMLTNLKQVYSK